MSNCGNVKGNEILVIGGLSRVVIAKRGVDFLVDTGSQVSLISYKLACGTTDM